MPDPVPVTVQNKVYYTPILNGEMDQVVQQIADKKVEIASLNSHLTGALSELTQLNKTLLAMYIQQTGQFPDA